MTLTRSIPRLVVAALRGGAGKTLVCVGLVAALRRRGLSVAAFKKGPDYIDAGWLGLAAGSPCHNLDPYLFPADVVRTSFLKRSTDKSVAVVEGNRGLFDGVDSAGSYSTAELAKLLKSPVVLIVDATKMTRTAAALVAGCKALDPEVDLQAVILNRIAGPRHETVVRDSIENAGRVPVVGCIRKMALENFPQRHLGLLPMHEHPAAMQFVEEAADLVEQSVDVDRLVQLASTAPAMACAHRQNAPEIYPSTVSDLRVGVLKDSAFQFYYPENLEALRNGGTEVVEISALEPVEMLDVDALYIGGGFPETHAARLAENTTFKASLRSAIEKGLPVYAECGGLMFLSRSLRVDENTYPMLGILPVDSVLERKPQGHGYIQVEVTGSNPFFAPGTVLTGHEFHYSFVDAREDETASYAFRVLRGHGIDGFRDGICTRNVLGTYVHLHALGAPQWSAGILRAAAEYRSGR